MTGRTSPRLPATAQALRGLRSAVRRRRVGPWHALVETFAADGVEGWVEVPHGAPPVRVALCVGDEEVGATHACDRVERAAEGEVRGFSFLLRDLWQFVGTGDRLSVRIDAAPVPIAGRGLMLVPGRDGEHDLAELTRRREAGLVFDRFGALRLSKRLDLPWQSTVLGLYARAAAVLEAERGLDVFLVYGTLLGAVRDGGFIGHDDDFDCAYVSPLTDPREVVAELQQIACLLIEHGLDVDCRAQLLHLHDADDPSIRIDLFHLFFDETGTLCYPWGAAGTTSLQRADWQGVREIEFAGGPALVPVGAEQLIEVLYGSDWRLPVPGFSWVREKRVESIEARVPWEVRQEVRWFRAHTRTVHDQPSPFCLALLERTDLPGVVVDLGCGDGRDAVAMAAAGRSVVGVDRSTAGVGRAAARATELGVADRAEFAVVDLGVPASVVEVLERARERAAGGPLLLHARFLLHAVAQEVQDALLEVLRGHTRPGDVLAAELRTNADRGRHKAFPGVWRRLQDGPALGRRLVEDGFVLIEEREGTGLAAYGVEDPVVYRVLARRR